MHVLEIKRNAELLAVIGSPNALMFSAGIAASIEDREVTLDARGMNDLGNNRESHTTWLELAPLNAGDSIAFRFTESEHATEPLSEVATDSPEHLAEQATYETRLQEQPLAPRQLDQKNPQASLTFSVRQEPPILPVLESGREFLSCRVRWNRWRPERCRVTLSSFSQQEALARTGGREWYNGFLQLGEGCTVEVGVQPFAPPDVRQPASPSVARR
jgi:hypothetical protein